MLETVHEYALELLTDSGELESIQRAHASYYLNLTERAAPCWNGPSGATGSEVSSWSLTTCGQRWTGQLNMRMRLSRSD
jgi:predicted ATPase